MADTPKTGKVTMGSATGKNAIKRVPAPAPKVTTSKVTMGSSAIRRSRASAGNIRRVPAQPKTIVDKVRAAGKVDPKKSLGWLYNLAGSKLKSANLPSQAFKERANGNVFIGGMFIYSYDAKWKDELPWWDALPVVIPISLYEDGWLGLNLHYLAPMLRARLLDKLMDLRRRAGTDRAYMKVSYEFLKGAMEHQLIQPCIHRYLASHVRTKVVRVEDVYWDKVAMLPIQKFQKKSAREVWRATQSRYSNRKKR